MNAADWLPFIEVKFVLLLSILFFEKMRLINSQADRHCEDEIQIKKCVNVSFLASHVAYGTSSTVHSIVDMPDQVPVNNWRYQLTIGIFRIYRFLQYGQESVTVFTFFYVL